MLRLLVFAMLLFSCAIPDETGKVVKVMDGDTIEILQGNKTKIRIRLFGIDAPEKKQDFGEASRNHLATLVAGSTVRVETKGRDKYKRVLGVVFLPDGKNINEEMIRSGYAWNFIQYSKSETYAALEILARKNKLGLWAGKNPMAPWEFRKIRKKKPETIEP